MAGRKEYELLLKLSAQMDGQFSGSFKKAQSEIASMQKELDALRKSQGDISAYQKHQNAVVATTEKLENLKKQYELVGRQIENSTEDTTELEREKLKLQQRISDTAATLENHERKVSQMGEALRSAGIDTENLAEENKRLAAQYDDVKSKQQGVIDKFNQGGNKAKLFGDETVSAVESIQDAFVAVGLVKLIEEVGEAMVDCAKASISFESAVTGVFKTVDGTEQQLAAINDEIKDLSTEIPATKEEIAAVAEAAGQLGIATDDVMDFTEVMINLGESTNLSAEEAASSLAKFSNITGMAANNYGRLGSTVVDLGNNFATAEADIVAMGTRLASAGRLAGLTEPEIMALAASMSSVGIEAEAGGTAMTQTLSAIEKAVVKGGDELNEFARIAGMSAQEFATAWETSPIQAIQAFIAGVGSLEEKGESATIVLEELGLTGIRQSNMLKSLGLAADTLSSAVNTANNAWNENIALSNEAGKRYAATESKLAMLDNAYSNLQVAIGDVYTPALRDAADLGIVVLEGITGFVEENPAAVKAFTALGIGAGAFAIALGGYVVASKAAEAATKALTKAMNANPYLLAGAAIVGVVSAVASLAIATEESGIPSVSELTEVTQEMTEVMDEAKEACANTVDSTMAAANMADTYIDKLEEMEQAGVDTAEETERYHSTLLLLCETVPELASYIDLENDTIRGGTAALRANTEAWKENAIKQALQGQLTTLYSSYAEVLVEAEKNQINLEKAETRYDILLDERNDKVARQNELMEQANTLANENARAGLSQADATAYLTEEYYDLVEEIASLDDELLDVDYEIESYKGAIEASAEATAQATADIATTEEAIANLGGTMAETAGMSEEVVEQTSGIRENLAAVNTEILALAENYQKAYTAAKESISGQYAIWDEAANVIPTKVGTINRALEDQASYWTDYSANLETLNEKAANIDGLSEMVASFADGSAESVNAIAGMAAASEEELAVMVENWKAVKEAEDTAAQGVADLSTGFSNSCDDMAQDVATFVEDTNLGEEAKAAAIATMQGYIDGAAMMLPQVQAAYANVGTAMANAMGMPDAITVPTGRGYASGTTNAERGFAMVGEEGPEIVYFNGGEQVLNARETAAIRNAPLEPTMPLMAAPVSDQTSNGKPVVSLQVNYEITSSGVDDLKTQIDYSAEHLRTVVRQVLDEYEDDRIRRAYR